MGLENLTVKDIMRYLNDPEIVPAAIMKQVKNPELCCAMMIDALTGKSSDQKSNTGLPNLNINNERTV